jgi:hypothetical protein
MRVNGEIIDIENDEDGTAIQTHPFTQYTCEIVDELYNIGIDYYKFRNWQDESYPHTFSLNYNYNSGFVPSVITDYKKTHPLTVTNNLEGGSYVKFKVKWTTFGEEEMITLDNSPYYAFHYPDNFDEYNITAFSTITGQYSTDWNFLFWQDGTPSETRYNQQITETNNSFTADYKGINRSNYAGAYANNSQRKFVRTPDGYLHMVYSSLGHIWYETSSDGGSTWQIMNDGIYLDSGPEAKLPSIDAVMGQYYRTAIVFQEKDATDLDGKVRMIVFNYNTDVILDNEVVTEITDYSQDADPVICVSNIYGGKIMIVFKKNEFGAGLYYRYGYLGYNESINWYSEISLLNSTGSNSKTPSITMNKANTVAPFNFYVAWEDNNAIKYCVLTANSQNSVSQSAIETPSSGNGYSINIKPSIAFYHTSFYPTIIWLVEEPITYIQKVQLRIKYGTNWSQFWTWAYGGGNDILSANINNNSSGKFVLAWGGDLNDKYLTSQSTTNTYNLPTQGDVQVSNAGTTMGDMKIMSFDKWNVPHAFTASPVTQGLYKTNGAEVVSKGFCLTKEAEIYAIDIGGIEADGKRILFNDLFDEDTTEAENRIESESFLLPDKSSFNFKMDYYSSVKEKVKPSEVLFKVKLIDAKSGDVLGVLKEENKQNFHYKNNGLKISTEGMGNREVKLLLEFFTDGFNAVKYNSVITDSTQLNKQYYQIINFAGDEIINDYALLQNYPNPFNPVTTISYQIPSDGMVRLVVYDLLGNEIETLINKYQSKGRYEVKFSVGSFGDASALASGMYLYRLTAGDVIITKKMLLLK